jgi:3-oxoacyl-[acyl-carrier protein] reductase
MNGAASIEGKRLAGRKAIVTGAAKGIGEGIARAFMLHGADVLVNYNTSEEKAQRLVQALNGSSYGGRAVAFRADVSKIPEIKSLVQAAMAEFGRIDILVNNAGVISRKNFLVTTEADYDRIMTVNVKGPYFCCQEVAPIMQKQGKGKIINISSVSGLAQPTGLSYPEYAASKAALIGLTRSLAVNLGPQILVNAVAPGTIRTDMTAAISPENLQRSAEEAFVKRLGEPEDIADACVFLASDESDFITGEVLTVSGGRGMR